MYSLENDKVKVSFDNAGNLQELINLQTGHNYAGGYPVWRMLLQKGKRFECEVVPETEPSIEKSGKTIVLTYDKNIFEGKAVKLGVKISVSLDDDNVKWSIELSNDEPGCIIRDLLFPVIHDLQLPEKQELIYPFTGGQKFKDIKSHIKKQHSYWKGKDHIFIQWKHEYPRRAATNCFTFAGAEDGLYCGLHTNNNEETVHAFRMYGDTLDISFGRYPGCGCRETWSLDGYVISPYNGCWHVPAKKYRSWLDSPECEWFELHEIPEWVRKMPGWQRIIMKHQYGEIHYKYIDMPEMREDGQQAGIDTLFMFGWQKGGHDNNYPDYTPDPELGTEEQLKVGVKDFTEHNGQVILYSNGQLIDLNSDFYKKCGPEVTIKDFNGNARRDAYLFSSTGHFYGNIANRSFEHGCPWSKKWEEVLAGVVDTAAAYGCQSAFFDQLGIGPMPCCDPNHGHPVPAFGGGAQRGQQIKRLRKRARSHSPEMAIGVEIITDVTACQADYVHSLSGFCKAMNDWEKTGEKPEHEFFIDWFRYIFPEIIISDREIRDDSDIERRVNHTVLKGLRNDVEIYRCRKTIAETPHYQEYLGKISHLRKKYSDLLLEGRYCDTENFIIDNEQIEARCFTNGDKLAVVLTQSHLKSATTNLSVPGYKYVDADGVNGIEVIKKDQFFQVEIKRHGLAIVIYEKEAK